MTAHDNRAAPQQIWRQADALFRDGLFDEAEALLRTLDLEGRYPLLLRRGQLALLADRQAEAERCLREAIRISPGEPEALVPLADLYRRAGRWHDAAPLMHALGDYGGARLCEALARSGPTFVLGKPPGPVALPLDGDGYLPLVRAQVNGVDVTLLVDTAAEEVALDTALARRAEVPTDGGTTALFAGGRTGAIERGLLERLALGPVGLGNLPVQVHPLTDAFRAVVPEPAVDGIIGGSALYRFRAVLAPDRLTLDDRDARARVSGDASPLRLAGAFLPVVPVGLDGRRECPALLDTGQAGCAFTADAETAAALGHDGRGPFTVGAGGGGSVALAHLPLRHLTLDGRRLERPSAGWVGSFPLGWRFGFHLGGSVGYDAVRDTTLVLDFGRMCFTVGD